MLKKLLITGAWKFTAKEWAHLKNTGYDICFVQNESDELPDEAYQAEAVICNGLFLHHDIAKFEKLKVVQLTSAGYDRVPMDFIKEHNIAIYNARGVYSKPMAEFAINGVLNLYKKCRFFMENQKNHRWEKCRDLWELSEKMVCIVGCGSVGQECAKRFSAFDCNVVGIDMYVNDSAHFDKIYNVEQLDQILTNADIVVLTVPLTEDTYHLMNKKRLGFLKERAVIVNISRGGVLDTQALVEVLPKLGGAVLDVFEEEPLSEDSLLWDFENVILTPHNSFVGEGNGDRLFNIIINNLS